MAEARPIAFLGARLVDPASGYDGPGSLISAGGAIAEVARTPTLEGLSTDIERVDCAGAVLAPGLVDIRVKTGEPGAETKETLKSAARAAVAGGVTSIVVQPDTEPAVDEPSVVDFILRRARDIGLSKVYPAGAATKGLAGEQMAEIGLMREAGCLYVTDVDRPIVNSQVMRRAMTYASAASACPSPTARTIRRWPASPTLTKASSPVALASSRGRRSPSASCSSATWRSPNSPAPA